MELEKVDVLDKFIFNWEKTKLNVFIIRSDNEILESQMTVEDQSIEFQYSIKNDYG